MFKKIFDLDYKRTPRQAVGFYIANVLIILVICLLIAAVRGLLGATTSPNVTAITEIGLAVSLIYTLALVCAQLSDKNLWRSSRFVILAICAVLLALLSPLLGLILPAYISAKDNGQQ